MTRAKPSIITCPLCGSQGDDLHRDLRASLVYFCLKCSHEWQIDPAEEPPQTDLTVVARSLPRSPDEACRSPKP